METFFDYLHKLRASKKVEIIDLKSKLLRRFPNLSTDQASAIVNMWMIENPYRYLDR